jgi:hypothetical protein
MIEEKRISIHRPMTKPTKEDLLATAPRRTLPYKPTPERPLIISASELRDWLRCRVKHHWSHTLRLTSVEESTNLALGSLVANGQDLWYQRPPDKRTVKAMERIAKQLTEVQPTEALSTESLELAQAMLIGFAAYAKEDDPNIGLVEAMPEQAFELPLVKDGSIIVRGRIDVAFVIKNKKKTMGFIESKTAKNFKKDIIEANLQLSVYSWAIRRLYPKYEHYIGYYQQLRKQLPGPRVTTPLFMREDLERDDDEVRQWEKDTEAVARDMLDAAIYPSPMDSCSWSCDFKMACLLRGTPDLLGVMRSEYKQKEERK